MKKAKRSSKAVAVRVKRLPHAQGLPLPAYQTSGAAGMDLVAALPETSPLVLKPGEIKLVPTGLIMELPQGFEAQVRPRSGLALKHGITLPNSPGTIDADYRGEVGVIMANIGRGRLVIRRGDRIAQLVVAPVAQARLVEVTAVATTKRGAGGFGSTGVRQGRPPSRANKKPIAAKRTAAKKAFAARTKAATGAVPRKRRSK